MQGAFLQGNHFSNVHSLYFLTAYHNTLKHYSGIGLLPQSFLFFSSCNWLRCFLTPWCLIMMDIFLLNKCFYLCNCWAFIWDWKAKINWEVASWTCTFHPTVYMLRNDQIWNTVICKIHKIFTPDFYLQLQIVFIGPQKSSLFCFWTLLTQILKKEHGSSRDFLNPQGLS